MFKSTINVIPFNQHKLSKTHIYVFELIADVAFLILTIS